MLIYRSDKDERPGADVWREVVTQAAAVRAASAHDEVVALLIALGEAESAIADSLFNDCDAVHPLADALRGVSAVAGRMLLASERHDRTAVERHALDLRRALAAIPVDAIPHTLALSVSEGYAYYALHPERYVEAVRQFVADCRPTSAVVIGIRSIGTSLAAVAAATLESGGVATETYSVRPRGHPFDRHLVLDPRLAALLARRSGSGPFLVVDEGPGLSGSSFAAVVGALTQLGVPARDVVLFPSWNPDGSTFKSETARAIWQRQRRYCVEASAASRGEAFDWRPRLYASEDEWPATQPQHERMKWVTPSGIVRFAGLGHYGAAKRQRAEILAANGLGPRPTELRDGYLTLPYVEGRPCAAADASPALIDAVASHVAAVTRLFPSSRRPEAATLQHMIETNVRLGLGDEWVRAAALSSEEERALRDAPAAAIDGRMLAHEWIRTPLGFTKVDALDHHADHFFPGTQDAGWDLAAAAIEFDLTDAARTALVDRYSRESGDADVRRRLPFYERAHLAFRLGYATVARDTLTGTAESSRFHALVCSYRARLARVLGGRSRR